jgi:CRISPR/Cas system CSM-associated protein Csm2 small subunit
MPFKKIEISLAFLTVLSALLAWSSVAQIISVMGASSWLFSIAFFALFLTFICLDIALFKDGVFLELLLLGCLLVGVIFTASWWHVLGVFLGGYFLFLASQKIRRDFELNVKIDFLKSLRTGKIMLILAISLVISMQYFAMISRVEGQILIPRMELGGISSKVAFKILAAADPSFKALENENITVDEFILENQKNQSADQGVGALSLNVNQIVEQELDRQNVPAENREQVRQQANEKIRTLSSQVTKEEQALFLAESRRQLALLVGREVSGSENISEIFSEMISKKIESVLTPSVIGKQQGSSSLAWVLAVILFFTVFSIGSLLSVIVFLLSWAIFLIFVRAGWVQIKTVTVEKEILA